MDELKRLQAIGEVAGKLLVLRVLLGEALSSRAPDYVEVEFPGWTERVRAALLSDKRS